MNVAKTTIPKEHTSIEQLKKSLSELGYKYKAIELGRKKFTQFTAPNGAIWFTSNTQINYPFVVNTATPVIQNKNLAYELAQKVGVEIPHTFKVEEGKVDESSLDGMLQHAPLIVKPSNSSLSRGLTLDIYTKKELIQGLKYAFTFNRAALIQQQVTGDEVRFAVFNGKVRAALLRQPPQVIGDGKRSVAELVAIENDERRKIDTSYAVYPQLNEKIVAFENVDMTEVLPKGKVLVLGQGAMIREGASVYDVTNKVHESYFAIVEKLAAQVGSGFIVIDLMIHDYSKPRTSNNYAFIEFNKSPILAVFYGCRDGKFFDALQYLTPLIDEALTGRKNKDGMTVGSFEPVDLPEFLLQDVVAKIDTGAYSGALHCTHVEVIKGNDNKPILRFALADNPDTYYETHDFEKKYVRSASGHRQLRYLIDTTIVLQGVTYPIKIGLSDRSKMKSSILIGRRFLRQNNMLVDVRINQEHDDEGAME